MLYRTEGVVLKSIEYGDADKIVTIYTKKYGKIQAIAKGVRKTKSKFGSSLEILTYAIFLFYKGKNIDIISQTEILESFFTASKEIVKFAFASNCAEVVNKISEEGEVNLSIFFLLKEVLHYLKEAKDPKLLNLSFKWQALAILGYKPSFGRCCICNSKIEEQKEMFFNIDEGGVICNKCLSKNKRGCIQVSLYFIKLGRKLLITPLSVISKATIPDVRIRELEKVTDLYLAYYSDQSFKTDTFLKSL